MTKPSLLEAAKAALSDWEKRDQDQYSQRVNAALRAAIAFETQRREKVERVLEAARNYKQAILDHSRDPCQCRHNEPDWKPCRGDCGSANDRLLLKALAYLYRKEGV